MGFIDSYKRLEKLCGEIMNDDRRVSAYIDEMINTPRGAFLVRGWMDDIKQLKHYRWIRNQIVHDPACSEENMCSYEDSQWLDAFYVRIMNQTDPLALYRKATQSRYTVLQKKSNNRQVQNNKQYKRKRNLCNFGLILLIAVVIVIAIWLSRG